MNSVKVIFVFAHPDDESFASAGTIVKLIQQGVEVQLITATRGEKGMSGNFLVKSETELGKIREEELREAARILGISQIHFLDYLDSTLSKVEEKEISQKILTILKKENPDIVVTFNEEGGSRHPDHIQISKCTTKAFDNYAEKIDKQVALYYTAMPQSLIKRLENAGIVYKVFGKIQGTPDQEITTKIDVLDFMNKKIKAIKAHKTQQNDWKRYLKRMDYPESKYEYFQLVRGNEMFVSPDTSKV